MNSFIDIAIFNVGKTYKIFFVDGGLGNNPVYMNLLADAFTGIEVFAASVPHASVLGTALVIHQHWNRNSLTSDIIELKYYVTRRNQLIKKHF